MQKDFYALTGGQENCMEKNAFVRAILHRNPGYRHPDYPAARGCGESCDLSLSGSLPKSPERFPTTHPSQVEYP